MQQFPTDCVLARQQGNVYPQLAKAHPEADLQDAYALQREFIKQLGLQVCGYKAALTAPPAQQAMGLNEPIVGVLLEDSEKSNSQPITAPDNGILETELGYVLGRDITAPVQAESVLESIRAVAPMVEIAHPNLLERPTGADLVATNSATYGYLKGPEFNPGDFPLDQIQTELLTEETTLFDGKCAEVMGGQLNALSWLINTTLALGYELHAGYLLMTGSVGGVTPSKSGIYQARYSLGNKTLEQIQFQLTSD